MAFNGVAKSTLKSNKQDYINILYSDSDSDHVPDLKLPPVKGKKQRRKKSNFTNLTKEDGGCGLVCTFKIILVLLVCATLVILAGLSMWTLQRVSELQEKVRALQSPEEGKNDFSLLQTQVKDLEKSLQELKKSDGILEHMKSTVTEIGVRLRKVEATTIKLNQSVIDAQSLLDTPKNLKSLTGIVGSLGSDFKEEQKTRSTKMEELEQRISALEANQLEKGQEPPEKQMSVDAQFRDMLSQQIADLNETSKSDIVSVKEQLNLVQGRLSALEAYAQSKQPEGLGHDEIETIVMDLIQEKMNNITAPTVAVPSSERTNGSSEEMSELSEKINRLTQLIEAKSDFAESMDLVSKGDFMIFQGDAELKFETINKTLFALSTELDSWLQRLDTIDTAVLNISAAAANSNIGMVDQAPTSISNRPSTTVVSVEEVAPVADQSEGSTSEISEEIDQALDQQLQHRLQIKGIETAEDLHKAFLETWPQHDGQINSEFVLSLLTNNSTDNARALGSYDANSDNFFNEEELQKALSLPEAHIPRRCKFCQA